MSDDREAKDIMIEMECRVLVRADEGNMMNGVQNHIFSNLHKHRKKPLIHKSKSERWMAVFISLILRSLVFITGLLQFGKIAMKPKNFMSCLLL